MIRHNFFLVHPFLDNQRYVPFAMHNIVSKNLLSLIFQPHTISGYYLEPYKLRKTMNTSRHRITQCFIIAAMSALCFFSCKKEVSVPEESSGQPTEEESSTKPALGKQYTIVPDAEGRLYIDNSNKKYQPGDILNLKGNFKSIGVNNLSGAPGKPIVIRNAPNTVTQIGNASWSGGAWAQALTFDNCHYVVLGGTSSKSQFVVNGSTTAQKTAYINIELKNHTDNFEIRYMTMKNGGTGIVAKTNPSKGDESTYYPNSVTSNLLIHDVTIDGTANEAMYIGHTALYWDLTANAPYYDAPSGFMPGHQYVQPVLWNNVKIYDNLVKNSGSDGIQTAAIDKLEVYNNEVSNWAIDKNPNHCGGILIGGRTRNTNVHDNYVHDGWGDICQFFGSGENGATHVINNNLFVNSTANVGIQMRGTANAIVQIVHNTVAQTAGQSIRVNGYTGQTGKNIISGNILVQPVYGVNVIDKFYIYLENGAQGTEGTGTSANRKLPTLAAAGLDATNFYQPVSGSEIAASGAGYRKATN